MKSIPAIFLLCLTTGNPATAGRGRLSPQGQVLFDSLVTLHRDAVFGSKAPTVTRVYEGTLAECDRITLGGPFRISGPKDFAPPAPPRRQHCAGHLPTARRRPPVRTVPQTH